MMVEKYRLNLIVAFVILLIVVWLVWTSRVWSFVGLLLLAGAIALITWTLLKKEKKPAKLLEFFVKSLVVSFVTTSIIWFVGQVVFSPQFLAYLNLDWVMLTLVYWVLPLSLLPVAVAVTVYGIFRIRLRAWEIFLAVWYIASFVVFAVYQAWWSLYIQPYLPAFYYSSFAAGLAFAFNLVLLSLLIAVVFTIVYVKLKKTKKRQEL